MTVIRLDEPIGKNTDYGYRTLNSLGASIARPGHQILGLTRGSAVVQLDIRIPSHIDRAGRWECASPQITLMYGFKPMTVYVAKEFSEGSCVYQEIHNHELRHVKAYQDHVVSIEKELAETLTHRFATGKPWRGPVGHARDRLDREFEERWVPYVKRIIGRVEAAQALIDTPQEYARIADSCDGEIRKRIR